MAEIAVSEKKGQKQAMDHAAYRCLDRYDVELTGELRTALLVAAKICPIKRVYRAGAKRWICTVTVQDLTYRIVCNSEIDEIITFLPRKAKHYER
jgi:hypothetical protein